MKWIAIGLLLSCYTNFTFGQVYSGKLINSQNHQPVPYANIGIVAENIGTISDVKVLKGFNIQPHQGCLLELSVKPQ